MSHLSTLTLHQYRYDELSEGERAAARAHLEDCARCARRLGVQQRERDAFVLQPMPAAIREAAEAPRSATGGLPAWLREWLPLGLALAAAALVFVAVPALRAPTVLPEDTITYRGTAPELEVWIDAGQGPRAMRAGERLAPGSRVQLVVDPRGAAWVSLAGVDATGEVEVYGGFAPPREGLTPAPFALTLDASPRQAFFAVTASVPLEAETVKQAVHGRVLPGVQVRGLEVPKEGRVR